MNSFKPTSKLLAYLLAFIMAFGLTTPAFAEEEPPPINGQLAEEDLLESLSVPEGTIVSFNPLAEGVAAQTVPVGTGNS